MCLFHRMTPVSYTHLDVYKRQIGMGVDANVITAERIKEELRNGKSIDGAIQAGFTRGFSAIFDGNITNVIVAIILMGAFGSSDSIFAKILSPIFGYFGYATEGSVFSFGYTLLVGVVPVSYTHLDVYKRQDLYHSIK